MKHLKLVFTLMAVLAVSPAPAHETKGAHGGRIVDAGSHHVELVVKDTDVSVFVTDSNDKKVKPTGFKALAIFTVGGKAQRIALAPADDKLGGKAEIPLPTDVKGVVQLTAPDGKVTLGQFK